MLDVFEKDYIKDVKHQQINEESDLNQDIINLLNSLSDSNLNDTQKTLKKRILNANFTLKEASFEQIQSRINMLMDRIGDLEDAQVISKDPVKDANLGKQIASLRMQLATLRKQKAAIGDQEEYDDDELGE